MEIKDLVGAGEAVTRLSEIVKEAIGFVFRPAEHRLLAASRKSEAMSAVDAVHLAEKKGVQLAFEDGKFSAKRLPVEERASLRVHHEEVARQSNVELITDVAFKQLENRTVTTQNKPAPDWTARYFESAKFVSDELMQQLWGKLLAEEVIQPGAFSLRTINILASMSSAEAKLFSGLASLSIQHEQHRFILHSAPFLQRGREFDFDRRIVLEDIGLIRDGVQIDFEAGAAERISVRIGERPFLIKKPASWPLPNPPIVMLTTSGVELSTLMDYVYSQEHENCLRETVCNNPSVTLEPLVP